MKRPPTRKGKKKRKTVVRHLKHGNPDQRWFEAHPHRKYRIRPKRDDEPGIGYLILKRLAYGTNLRVDIGPGGAILADNDEALGKVYCTLRGGKRCVFFPHGGTVVGWGES